MQASNPARREDVAVFRAILQGDHLLYSSGLLGMEFELDWENDRNMPPRCVGVTLPAVRRHDLLTRAEAENPQSMTSLRDGRAEKAKRRTQR